MWDGADKSGIWTKHVLIVAKRENSVTPGLRLYGIAVAIEGLGKNILRTMNNGRMWNCLNDIGRNMWCSMSDSYREAEKKMFLVWKWERIRVENISGPLCNFFGTAFSELFWLVDDLGDDKKHRTQNRNEMPKYVSVGHNENKKKSFFFFAKVSAHFPCVFLLIIIRIINNINIYRPNKMFRYVQIL